MTNVEVQPVVGTLDATVDLPGSKSLTNRALVVAALATGESLLSGCGLSDDTEAMIGALHAFGVGVERDGTSLRVSGSGGALTRPRGPLDARMSGTTARFVTPLLLCSGGGTIDGHEQMRGRPMGDLVEAMRTMGATVVGEALPLSVELPGDLLTEVSVASHVSSQFTSGLLLAAPGLEYGLTLRLTGETVSQPYIDMTVAVMRAFGATVEVSGSTYRVAPGGYLGTNFGIEPDASTASYPLAAAAMVGGRIRVNNLGTGSVQGDFGFTDVIERMGATVHRTPEWVEVRGSGVLTGCTADLSDMSDTAPTFAVLAARAIGTSSATGIGFIRTTKESDRVGGAVTELQRLGVQATTDSDGFTVIGGPHSSGAVETYDDHRMAMSLALLGLTSPGITVTGAECVAKTFPGFFGMLDNLRETARTAPQVVAIDGPAGSGKSTVAAMVAERLRLPHLDTGAMYRAVTLAVLRSGTNISDDSAVSAAAESAVIDVEPSRVLLNGEDVTTEIRNPDVTAAVSPVAAVGGVRRVLAQQQREWAIRRGAAVVEGRDIGSAVFPDASIKIYLTASVAERARRRAAEVGSNDLAEMEERICARDDIDTNREHDPLTISEGAVVIDSTDLEIDAVVEQIVTAFTERHES